MKKIYGTGKPSAKTGKVHLPKGQCYIVPDAMAEVLVELGRARFEREVEEIVPPKEKEKQSFDSEVKEKVEVIVPKKKRYGKQ